MGLATILGLNSRRAVARAALVVTLTLFASTVLLSGGPLSQNVNAQGTGSPAPEFTIQFLNPSGDSAAVTAPPPPSVSGNGPGKEISAKDDGTGTRYHLVAWINKTPGVDPEVEFTVQQGAGQPLTLTEGGANRAVPVIGAPDTYHFYWNVAATGLVDGEATLKAVLYSGNTPLATDSETVRINNGNPSPMDPNPDTVENQGETVEMLYPVQTTGGSTTPAWGFYAAPAGPPVGVIDVTSSSGTVRVPRLLHTVAPRYGATMEVVRRHHW